MKPVLQQVKDFFEPVFLEYEMLLPVDTVIDKFNEALDEHAVHPKPKGLMGSMEGTEFTMGIISADNTAAVSAALKGKITEKKEGVTRLEVYIIRSAATYMTFFLSIIAAVIYLIMYWINPNSKDLLLWGFGALIAGTVFSILIANISARTVHKQFVGFLDNLGTVYWQVN